MFYTDSKIVAHEQKALEILHIWDTYTSPAKEPNSLLLEHLGKLANGRSPLPSLSPAASLLMVAPVLLAPVPEHEVAEATNDDEAADRQRRWAVAP